MNISFLKNKCKFVKKVLITGIFGQDGMILSNLLPKNKYLVLGQYQNFKKKIKLKKIIYKKIDLTNIKDIIKNLNSFKPNYIIHLASKNNSNSRKFIQIKKIHYEYNYKISKNLIDASLKLEKRPFFIFAGSSEMYGNNRIKVSEKDKFKPKDHYSKYKTDFCNYLIKLKKKFSIRATTLILFNHDSIYRNKKFLLPKIISHIKNKKIKKLQTIYNLNIKGDFSHAENICTSILKLIKKNINLDKIILSSGKSIEINDIVNRLILSKKLKINLYNNKNYLNINTIGNNKLAKKNKLISLKKTYYDAALELFNIN